MDTAEQARDLAVAQVVENTGNWKDQATAYIKTLKTKGWMGTGEDLRLLMTQVIGAPHHHNAWGGIIMGAVRRGDLVHANQYRKMNTAASHARKTPVYSTFGAAKTDKGDILKCATQWLEPGMLAMIDPSMTEREQELMRKIVNNIALALKIQTG